MEVIRKTRRYQEVFDQSRFERPSERYDVHVEEPLAWYWLLWAYGGLAFAWVFGWSYVVLTFTAIFYYSYTFLAVTL